MKRYEYEKSEWAWRIEAMRRADRAKRDAESVARVREFWRQWAERREQKPIPARPAPNTATCPVCSGHGHIAITTDAPDDA